MATRTEVAIGGLRSLAWAGDDLIDWIGGKRIGLDGTIRRFGTGYTYRFDAAIGLGDVGVMFETLGTKGRLVRANGQYVEGNVTLIGYEEIRELDRSYYQATAYAFPACVFRLRDGREVLAHCPRSYDMLELELLDGTPLTRRTGEPEDIFHSRLTASPDGRWLLSAGWVWQPWNIVCVYDVERALIEPTHLSTIGIRLDLGAFEGESDAAVLLGDRVVVAGSPDCPALSVIELPSGKNLTCTILDAALGRTLCAWGPEHIVALDGTPRVVALDGTIIETFDGISTVSLPQPSVNLEPPTPPFLAIDPRHPRFAVGDEERITIIAR